MKSRHQLYGTWYSMMKRCYDPKRHNYKYYGGRGITVCERWHDFSAFVEDMSPRPAGLTLDRIDNDAGYSKANCRWADQLTQMNNRSGRQSGCNDADFLSKAKLASAATGLSVSCFYQRLARGMEENDIFNVPPMHSSRTRRDRLNVTYQGKTLHYTKWANLIGISPFTLRARLARGWSVEKALTASVRKRSGQ